MVRSLRFSIPSVAALLGLAVVVAVALFPRDVERAPVEERPFAFSREVVLPLPPIPRIPKEKVDLGRTLFFEKRLSRDGTISCASCHDPARGGADGLQHAVGIGGAEGSVNTPTVFNAALNVLQFWDGRANTLEAQASGPVHNPIEMDSSWEQVTRKLEADPVYVSAFRALYKDGITADNIVDAIAAFERTLISSGSRFDRYLRGDAAALTESERRGYERFLDYGCASCHQGAAIGGNMLQKFGVLADRLQGRKPTNADLGRFNVTRRDEDKFVFKVPGLRDVARTAPYFHDGSVATLPEAVIIMGRVQLGRELTPDDVGSIVAFLGALSGDVPRGAQP